MNRPPHQSRAGYVLRAIWSLLFDAANGWLDHRASRTGAALAFYTVFSLAPVLILSIAIAGFFFGEAAARGEIVDQIGDLVGPQGAELVQAVLRNASKPGAGVIATIVSVVTLILGPTPRWPSSKRVSTRLGRCHRNAAPASGTRYGLVFCPWG